MGTQDSDTPSYSWSQKSLEELVAFYEDEIRPSLQVAGQPPDERPSYRTLADHGYSGLSYALREHHDLTLTEFLSECVGYTGTESKGNTWGIDDEETVAELESYCQTLRDRRGQADTTVRSKRSRLARYAQAYAEIHGAAPIIRRVADRDRQPEEIERNLAVFDELDDDLGSDATKLRYLGTVDQFYNHLQRRRKATYNPVSDLDAEYDWSRETGDNPGLDAEQVRALVKAVETPTEELLVYATCAWGLRRSEVAELHVSQLQLAGEDPAIHFDQRKNGPSTVTLIYGRDVAADRVTALNHRSDWSGYLLPSGEGSNPHISPDTVYRRFQRLAERADVQVRGEPPTPQMGRRFWYTTYSEAMEDLVESVQPAAADQGSSDASVVAQNYLSEDRRREYRRNRMHDRLAAVFEPSENGSRDG